VFAAGNSIDNYVPPPMFGESVIKHDLYPPLPPRRPEKLKASKSYIEYLRKYGKAPQVNQYKRVPAAGDIRTENLIQPSAQDILEQINPQ